MSEYEYEYKITINEKKATIRGYTFPEILFALLSELTQAENRPQDDGEEVYVTLHRNVKETNGSFEAYEFLFSLQMHDDFLYAITEALHDANRIINPF